ncbi:hypothetical protein B9057_07195 [Aestuarium zhoushanense]|nr:hypothetical protein B9057_07195 [Aestuarium zhoushanense]
MTHKNTLLFISPQQRQNPNSEFFLYFKSESALPTNAIVENWFDLVINHPDTKFPHLSTKKILTKSPHRFPKRNILNILL